nr:hypothetical protein [uncultured Pedobacter sp.]
MNFGLAVNVSVEISSKTSYIQSLSDELEAKFKNKNYGKDIKSFTIGILCVSPQFDQFYKKRIKPKYVKGIKVIKPDGISFTLEDNFEYSVKIDFEIFKNAEEQEAKKVLAGEILGSLVVFDTMRSKIKDFDLVSFKTDLVDYFERNQLI